MFRRPADYFAAGALGVLLAVLFIWAPNFQEPSGPEDTLSGADYLQFYVAAQLVRHGFADRLYDFPFTREFQHDPAVIPYEWDADTFGLCIYPPFFVWFCFPFSLLPYHAGAIAWTVVMGLLFLAAVALMSRERGEVCRFGAAVLLALLFRPLLMSLYTCQNATLSLLLLTGVYLLLRRERLFWAGVVFAGLAFKPQLVLVIGAVMLIKRQWRFFGGAVAGGVVLLAAGLAVSPQATADYLRIAPTMSRWIEMPGMPLERMSCWYGFWKILLAGAPLWTAQAATVVSALLTLVPMWWLLRRSFEWSGSRFRMQFATLVIGTILLSPHLLSYDLTLLLIPIYLLGTQVLVSGDARHARLRGVAVVLFVAASISEAVAVSTGIQLVVPAMLGALLLMGRPAEVGASASPVLAET